MTSCGGRSLKETFRLKYRSKLLRVKTAAYPFAKVDLNLRNGKSMAGKYSYVGLKKYKIELRTLGLYKRQIGDLCLTGQSLKKLLDCIRGQ